MTTETYEYRGPGKPRYRSLMKGRQLTLHEVEVGAEVERDVVQYGARRCMAVVTRRDETGTWVQYVGERQPVFLPRDDPGPEGWTLVGKDGNGDGDP